MHAGSFSADTQAAGPPNARSTPDDPGTRRVRGRGCASILAATLLLLFVICVVVVLLVRFRSVAAFWPSPDEVGLVRGWAVVNGGLLVVSGVMIWLAGRASSVNRRRMARGGLLLAAVCGVVALGIWLREHRSVLQRGISPWNVRGTVFPHADLLYMQAVKNRLKTLHDEFEEMRTQHPRRYDDQAKRQQEMVVSLQDVLVNWTEQEVGHWLDDVEQRRDAIRILAYQVCPNAAGAATIRDLLATERSVREQRRQWLLLLREHCQTRLARVPPTNALPGGGVASSVPDSGRRESELGEARQAPGETDESLQQSTRSRLQRLGGSDWAFAQAVLDDPAEAVLIGERLNQIQAALGNLDAREAFLQDEGEPLAAGDLATGLNRRYSFLRLPVCLPPGRAWAAGFTLLTGGHGVMLLCGSVMLAWLAVRGRGLCGALRTEPAVWFWWVTIACGLIALLLLYAS
jgi:heme/copper-type cytochrome/quinol oxidase subunit 3